MNTKKKTIVIVLALVIAFIVLTAGLASAQQDHSRGNPGAPEAPEASNYLPIQGRLTNASGQPLDGEYTAIFRLYDISMGGTALCQDTVSLTVIDGVFSSYMKADSCPIDGRQLYLGVEVAGDGEMEPRQYIDNVPYAWSLRPGAKVESNADSSILYLNNLGEGVGLWGASLSGAGVHGASGLKAGVEGYSLNGPGVYGESLGGVAIAANGIITSTEPTYLWISGNDVRAYGQTDSTIINLDSIGGAKIFRGTSAGNKNVVLPITVPGTLYGQDVKITGLNIYWVADTTFEGILTIRLRRQTGVCASCYQQILADLTDYTCEEEVQPTGCVISNSITTDNVLASNAGILYLTLELSFGSDLAWIELGGARLTLEYNQ